MNNTAQGNGLRLLLMDVKAGYRFSLTLVFDEKSGEMQVPLVFTKPRPQPVMHEHRM